MAQKSQSYQTHITHTHIRITQQVITLIKSVQTTSEAGEVWLGKQRRNQQIIKSTTTTVMITSYIKSGKESSYLNMMVTRTSKSIFASFSKIFSIET